MAIVAFFLLLSVSGAGSTLFFRRAHATEIATAALEEAVACTFDDQLEELRALRTAKQITDPLEQIYAELTARKALLITVIDCALTEAHGLRSRLEKIEGASQSDTFLKRQLRAQVDESINYYKLRRLKVKDLGLQGTKDMARELLAWRRGNYAATTQRVLNLETWLENKELLDIAHKRLMGIETVIGTFKLLEHEDVAKLLESAVAQLDEAAATHISARQAIENFSSPEPAQTLIKETLKTLSQVYEDFLQLSKIATSILFPQEEVLGDKTEGSTAPPEADSGVAVPVPEGNSGVELESAAGDGEHTEAVTEEAPSEDGGVPISKVDSGA